MIVKFAEPNETRDDYFILISRWHRPNIHKIFPLPFYTTQKLSAGINYHFIRTHFSNFSPRNCNKIHFFVTVESIWSEHEATCPSSCQPNIVNSLYYYYHYYVSCNDAYTYRTVIFPIRFTNASSIGYIVFSRHRLFEARALSGRIIVAGLQAHFTRSSPYPLPPCSRVSRRALLRAVREQMQVGYERAARVVWSRRKHNIDIET